MLKDTFNKQHLDQINTFDSPPSSTVKFQCLNKFFMLFLRPSFSLFGYRIRLPRLFEQNIKLKINNISCQNARYVGYQHQNCYQQERIYTLGENSSPLWNFSFDRVSACVPNSKRGLLLLGGKVPDPVPPSCFCGRRDKENNPLMSRMILEKPQLCHVFKRFKLQ